MNHVVSVLVILGFVTFAAGEEIVRKPWTTSRLHGSPEPAKPYMPEAVYTKLAINNGLELIAHEGRFFVVERGGKIWSFREDGDGSAMDLFADLKTTHSEFSNAYGLAFHPRWRENREIFLAYTIGNELEDGTKVSRFRVSEADPPRLLPESEEVLLTWRSGGHNGANLQLGPDGMLYISTGDATSPSPPDGLKTGQDNSDFLSAILRIDINAKDPGLAYRIPPDNPWVGTAQVRPEIWSFGFRNPWKMSFDEKGRLWVGDVGWELWEMIHLAGKGTNHGWSAMEASQPILPETASPLAPITPPVAAHPHSEAASITGGFVYRGTRLPELRGAYVYGDYETGKIWAIRHDGPRPGRPEEIADTAHKIATFGLGSDGEIYYLHYGNPTTMFRLTKHPKAGQTSDFPRKLSETGLFRDIAAGLPNDGVYEFSIHEAMWQDGAEATRLVALPGEGRITKSVTLPAWPIGTALAKTIRLGKRPVETQVLLYDGETWSGYSYRWNEEGGDATLVESAGEEFDVPAAGWKGGTRYRIHSRAECMRCHTSWNEFVAGFQPVQLAGFTAFPGQSPRDAALALGLTDAHYFDRETAGHLLASRGPGSVETRARSWLHANCAHCHRRHGGGSAPLEVNFDRALSEAALLWQAPTRGDFGLTDARAVVPGEPSRSVLNYRVSSFGSGHMPPLGPREVDEKGAALLWDWVAAMPRETPIVTEAITAHDPGLLTNPSSAMRLAHALAAGKWEEKERSEAINAGLASANPEIRVLFERFRPPGDRPSAHRHEVPTILKLTGDPDKGAKLLTPVGKLAACFACHRLGKDGVSFGPDLSTVGERLDRAAILESLLIPSKTIAPEFFLWAVETRTRETLQGFISQRDAEQFTLQTGPGATRVLSLKEVRSSKPQTLSLMPAGLVDFLTPQEVADLVAFLTTRRDTVN